MLQDLLGPQNSYRPFLIMAILSTLALPLLQLLYLLLPLHMLLHMLLHLRSCSYPCPFPCSYSSSCPALFRSLWQSYCAVLPLEVSHIRPGSGVPCSEICHAAKTVFSILQKRYSVRHTTREINSKQYYIVPSITCVSTW